jgi:hypothetical protein
MSLSSPVKQKRPTLAREGPAQSQWGERALVTSDTVGAKDVFARQPRRTPGWYHFTIVQAYLSCDGLASDARKIYEL